ncbi:MAG: hypothetical protein LKH74_10970 [Levilactobacillus sp.]|uniref:hypothetical protein n=1 Tax=Levilactobacillus sp. TaxID=2767919 RepID=UPI00258A2CC0|nr:hypothetical protein [Levilactobacillus sp.]MCI1554431.1 hypothetical protein [Levilactobacillus sp.]MCI1598238.1 hypothetical protein [Levilactobacillus sp.]MCI1605913.1 hypothetical protein [Levilactobacillus sp.]
MKKRLFLIMVLLLSGLLLGVQPTTAQGASRRVLIVYDALNPTVAGQQKLAGLQQLLASTGVATQTEKLSDYYAGQLTTKKYSGVVTLVNWPQGNLHNAAFTRDRQAFSGQKLHIGQQLSRAEARQLHAVRHNVYHQQLTVTAGDQRQLLPFSEDITLLRLKKGARHFGQLQPQNQGIGRYPYGTVVGHAGYLPYFESSGFSQVLAGQTIAQLFGRVQRQRPLLTVTGVTPYSNLTRLTKLASKLNAAGIPFAVSTTSVADNTSLRAFSRFTKALRVVENNQGVIFLQVPIVGAANRQSGPLLERTMVEELNQLGQRQVIPVGISAPIYWNQDKLFRRHGLARASNVLLLPNPATTTFANQDNRGATYPQTWTGLSLHSLLTVKNGRQIAVNRLKFPVKTALTVSLPTSQKRLTALLKQVTRLDVDWYQPQAQLRAKITSGSATFGYHDGVYYLNGSPVTVGAEATGVPNYHFSQTRHVALDRYFKVQGNILFVFFTITTMVLVVFLFLGRRIYRQMFRR